MTLGVSKGFFPISFFFFFGFVVFLQCLNEFFLFDIVILCAYLLGFIVFSYLYKDFFFLLEGGGGITYNIKRELFLQLAVTYVIFVLGNKKLLDR